MDIRDVPRVPAPARAPAAGADSSPGSVVVECGRNEQGHYNEDNLVVSPGLRSGAHHTHAYVGNLSTDAMSTDASLAAAATSCAGGDRSTYYWPVLRRLDRPGTRPHERAAGHGNAGAILPEASVLVEFRGSPVSKVVAMPRFLRGMTGDAVAHTADSDADVRARWGCSSFPDRSTTRYPRCPEGDRVTRTLIFPSCWNGLDTAACRAPLAPALPRRERRLPGQHLPGARTAGLPRLRGPRGRARGDRLLPEQRHSPKTDHAMFVNAMTERQMAGVVGCLNEGRACRN